MKKLARIILGVALAAAGCGSSGANADGGSGGHGGGGGNGGGSGGNGGSAACAPIIPGDGVMTWNDDGVAECGTITIAGRMTSSSQDFIEIIGATTTGIGVGITVVRYGGTLGGTYNCKNDAGIGSLYVDFEYRGKFQDCTITIDNPGAPGGAHATGSFSGTFAGADGGTIEVTNGTFDTPVMLVGG
ncbi:MAG TPA: hypothetical protein VHJ20_16650 [Polyangia bacterium]|nr:hypothetical protein [Polyangia bacterium]